MKKIAALILTVIMILILTIGCSPGNSNVTPATSEDESSSSDSQDKPVNLSLSVANYSSTSAFGVGMKFLSDKIEEYSGGTITSDVFYDSSLGDFASQVQALQSGALDILVVGNTYYTSFVPELQVFELPFIFDGGKEQARKVLDGDAGKTINEKFEGSGVKMLRYWEVGVRQLTNNIRPIHSINDLKGLRIRTLPVEVQVKAWELFGAKVTPIDGAELFTALQQGVVDGQENPLEGIYANKLYEVQKHITLTNHVYTPAGLSISESTFNRLSKNQQEAVLKAVDEATVYFRKEADIREEEAIVALKDAGIQFVENPDISGFVELAPKVYTLYTDKYGNEMIDLINASK